MNFFLLTNFFQYMNNHVPALPRDVTDFSGPTELQSYLLRTVLMALSLSDSIFFLIFFQKVSTSVLRRVLFISQEEQLGTKMLRVQQGQMRKKVNSSVYVRQNFCGHSAFWETLDGYICMLLHKRKYARWLHLKINMRVRHQINQVLHNRLYAQFIQVRYHIRVFEGHVNGLASVFSSFENASCCFALIFPRILYPAHFKRYVLFF